MIVVRDGGAFVRFMPARIERVTSVNYGGLFTGAWMEKAWRSVTEATLETGSYLVDVTAAAMALVQVPVFRLSRGEKPAVIVVTPDQAPLWRQYSRRMALQGVTRVVFLKQELKLAQYLAGQFARCGTAKAPRLQHDEPRPARPCL